MALRVQKCGFLRQRCRDLSNLVLAIHKPPTWIFSTQRRVRVYHHPSLGLTETDEYPNK